MKLPQHILFIEFLQLLREKLGYKPDPGKLKWLMDWATQADWDQPDLKYTIVRVFKTIFLQDQRDEKQFEEILYAYMEKENQDFLNQLRFIITAEDQIEEETVEPPSKDDTLTDRVNAEEPTTAPTPKAAPPTSGEELPPPPPDQDDLRQQGRKFINIRLARSGQSPEQPDTGGTAFRLDQQFLPFSERDMVQTWRHLRRKGETQTGEEIDIPATIRRVARQGYFSEPAYEKQAAQAKNILLILADRGGSMTPFHTLTDRLIGSAHQDGGLKGAAVYYFHNLPGKQLFRSKHMVDPEPWPVILKSIRSDRTNVLIISDGGAARGNDNPDRLRQTKVMLDHLNQRALNIAWLNPMPRNRWPGTTAARIPQVADVGMYSLLDTGKLGMLRAIQWLMGKMDFT